MELKIFHGFDCELKVAWKDLELRSSTYIFQNYEWNELWSQTVGEKLPQYSPHIGVIYVDSLPVMLFPMILCRRYFALTLQWCGSGTGDYFSPIFDSSLPENFSYENAWELFLNSVPHYQLLFLDNIPEIIGNKVNPFLSIWRCSQITTAYSVSLPSSWHDLEKRISKKLANDTRRQILKLSKLGASKYEVAASNEQKKQILDAVIEQKSKQYIETGAINSFSRPGVLEFYEQLHKNNDAPYSVHLSSLRLDDAVIACHWGVIYKSTFYWLLPAYLRDGVEKYSPGRILMVNTIKDALANHLKKFDFTIGSESYKLQWSDTEMRVYAFLETKNIFCICFIGIFKFVRALKRHELSRKYLMRMVSFCRNLP